MATSGVNNLGKAESGNCFEKTSGESPTCLAEAVNMDTESPPDSNPIRPEPDPTSTSQFLLIGIGLWLAVFLVELVSTSSGSPHSTCTLVTTSDDNFSFYIGPGHPFQATLRITDESKTLSDVEWYGSGRFSVIQLCPLDVSLLFLTFACL